MKIFTNLDYEKAVEEIAQSGRKLEYYLSRNLYENMSREILAELKHYQNTDGGFGNALEPDLRVPDSSAAATEFAINIMKEHQMLEGESIDMLLIIDLIKYLEATFDEEKKFWPIAPPTIDAFPRAVWWNYENIIERFGMFNPTATFIGFLFQFKSHTSLDVDALVAKTVDYIVATPVEKIEEHELFCLIRFSSYMPDSINKKINAKLNAAIEHTIEKDPNKWYEYAPEPIKYITSPVHPLYPKYESLVMKNVDYILADINEKGIWCAKHVWYQFDDVFEATAKNEWAGFFTYENLKRLKTFNRCEL